MLHVRTEVKPSTIHGLGLFSTSRIKAGQRVWRFNRKLDHGFTGNYLDCLPDCVAEQIRKYSYVNSGEEGLYILCGDDARFLNFPKVDVATNTYVDMPNLKLGNRMDGEYDLLAARDIEAGEELTVPLESDADADRKLSS